MTKGGEFRCTIKFLNFPRKWFGGWGFKNRKHKPLLSGNSFLTDY